MKYILSLIFFLSLALPSNAQIDSVFVLAYDSTINVDSLIENIPFSIPFNNDFINTLDKKSEIIALREPNFLKQNIFLILLNLLTITVLLFNISRVKVAKVLATLFNINMLKQFSLVEIKRDNKYLWAYFLLLLLFFSLVIYVLSFTFNREIDVWFVSVVLLVYLIFDLAVNLVTAYILKQYDNYAVVLFNNASFLILSIPFIISSLLLMVYLPERFNIYYSYFFVVIVFILYIWKEIRNIIILGSNKIKIFSFYFFLYLCTFKILPIAVLVKTVLQELIK